MRVPFKASRVGVSGHYALFSPKRVESLTYALFDDRTRTWRRFTAPCQPELGPYLGPPWVFFDCASARLYNLTTHRWRHLDCGGACVNTGVAAAVAMGSHWIAYDQDAFCDPKYFACDGGVTYVSVPAGANRRVTYDPGQYIDLNSRSLVRPVCAPLSASEFGWTFFGRFGVGQDQAGLFVQHCASTRQTRLIASTPSSSITGPEGNAHAIFACDNTTDIYTGLFVPSMRLFTFSFPRSTACSAVLGDRYIYTPSWHARFPTH